MEENNKPVEEKNEKSFSGIFKSKKVMIPSVIGIVILLVLMFIMLSGCSRGESICNGVNISGTDVSGMTKEQASAAVNSFIETELLDNVLTIEYEGNSQEYPFSELVTEYKVDEAVENAYAIGRNKNIFVNAFEAMGAALSHRTITLEPSLDDTFLVEFAENYAKNVENALEENAYSIENNELILINGKRGYSIDESAAIEEIKKALISVNDETVVLTKVEKDPVPFDVKAIHDEICTEPVNAKYEVRDGRGYLVQAQNGYNFNVADLESLIAENTQPGARYALALEVIEPEQTEIDTGSVFPDVLAKFTSKITDKNAGRLTNVRLATEKIDGVILNPDEVFYYLRHVEPITAAAGYQVANVYVNGKVEKDIGGGVCQVSSALYSAVLYSDLEVVRRFNHGLTVGYVPLGQDATVASGDVDFRFRNNTDAPIMIIAQYEPTGVHITIKGTKKDKSLSIELENITIETLSPTEEVTEDPSLAPGVRVVDSSGQMGYVVETYKNYYRDGQFVKREYVSRSRYKATVKKVRVGPQTETQASAPAVTVPDAVEPAVQSGVQTPAEITVQPSEVPQAPVETEPETVQPSQQDAESEAMTEISE